MILPIAVLSCVVSLAVATKYCCTPDQWEGNEGLLGGDVPQSSNPKIVLGGAKISYDATNNRTAAVMNMTVDGEPAAVQTIQVGGVLYVIDLMKKTCNKQKKAFARACIPDEAKSMGEFYFGGGSSILKGQSYSYNFQQQATSLTMFFTVTNESCYPISQAYYGSSNKVSVIQTIGFVNITPGIKDPSVFIVPSICNTEDAEEDEVLRVVRAARQHRLFVI